MTLMFHSSPGQCITASEGATQGTRHRYKKPIEIHEVARQCELDSKCSGFHIDEESKDGLVSSSWLYNGEAVKGDGKDSSMCYSRMAMPSGFFAVAGSCEVDGKASGHRVAGLSMNRAAQLCNADEKCVGFDIDVKDSQQHAFFVTDGDATKLSNSMKKKPSSPKTSRVCLVRSDPHIPEGFKRQQGRCAIKTGHGASKCEPEIFEAPGAGSTIDAKSFSDAISKCRARDDCTAVTVDRSQPSFSSYTIHTKDDVQGDTCSNAFCFVRDISRHTKSSPTKTKPDPHKRCDSQPFVPDDTATPFKVLKTVDPKTCQRQCLAEGVNCNAWKINKNDKEGGCELFRSWNGVHKLDDKTQGSLCFNTDESDIKGFTDNSISFAVWDKSTVIDNGENGVATFAKNERECAENCTVTRGCKAFAFEAGTNPDAAHCDGVNGSGCGVCYVFNAAFESGHTLFRHTDFSHGKSMSYYTANRV